MGGLSLWYFRGMCYWPVDLGMLTWGLGGSWGPYYSVRNSGQHSDIV